MKFRLVESVESHEAETIINDEFGELSTKYKRQVNPGKHTISTTNVFAHIYQEKGEFCFEIAYKKLPVKIVTKLKAMGAEELSNQFGLCGAESDSSKKGQKFTVKLEDINDYAIKALVQKPLQIQEYINSIKRKGKA